MDWGHPGQQSRQQLVQVKPAVQRLAGQREAIAARLARPQGIHLTGGFQLYPQGRKRRQQRVFAATAHHRTNAA